jgi:hypothetical protein
MIIRVHPTFLFFLKISKHGKMKSTNYVVVVFGSHPSVSQVNKRPSLFCSVVVVML